MVLNTPITPALFVLSTGTSQTETFMRQLLAGLRRPPSPKADSSLIEAIIADIKAGNSEVDKPIT